MFYLQWILYDGEGRKTSKYTKKKKTNTKNKEKIPRLVESIKWESTVFRCPETPKISLTFPKWERVPNLMEQNI